MIYMSEILCNKCGLASVTVQVIQDVSLCQDCLTKAKDELDFKVWMSDVNTVIGKLCFGLSHTDLPDKCWRLWHDDGLDCEEAAEMCLEEEGFYD